MQAISVQKLFLLYWDPGQHNSMLQAMLVALKKLYMDPYPPSVHLSVSPLRSIETVFIAMHMAIIILSSSPTCSNFQ